jgi:RNA polymerase sigma-70 factor, ECF subfamily
VTAMRSVARTPALEPVHAPHETEAARRLYERYSERVFKYCHRRLRSREEAEDALQTTFLHALRGLRRGVVPDAEVAWLLKIAHSVCLTRWETARRAAVEVARDPHVLEEMLVANVAERDELITLPEALERLTENQRRAILLREWQGLSYREIAEELELSDAAVETLLFRARRALAQGLSGDAKVTARAAWTVVDVASLLAGIRSLFSGGASLKVATAIAVVGATLGTGGAVEQRGRELAWTRVAPVADAADHVGVRHHAVHGRSVEPAAQQQRQGRQARKPVRLPGGPASTVSRNWAAPVTVAPAGAPAVVAEPLPERPTVGVPPAGPGEQSASPRPPVSEVPHPGSPGPAMTRPKPPFGGDGSLVEATEDSSKAVIDDLSDAGREPAPAEPQPTAQQPPDPIAEPPAPGDGLGPGGSSPVVPAPTP